MEPPEPITIQLHPQWKQHLCYQYLFDAVTRFIGFGGGAGGGKTWLGCEWLLQMCYRYPGSKWFIGRKELKRLMASTYVTWQKVCAFHQVPADDWHLDGKYNVIRFTNGSMIDLLDVDFKPSDPMYERFGSTEYTGGWGEEVGEWHFLAFDVLKSRIGRWKNDEFGLLPPKFLLTFNPTKNWLYRIFYKRWRDKTLPKEYSFTQALYMDNQYTAEEYGKALDEISDPVTKMRLKRGIWEYDDEDTALIRYDAIIDLFTNSLVLSSLFYITADIARFGSDRTVIGVWRGFDLIKVIIRQHQDTGRTATELRTLMRDYHVQRSHVVVDEDGVGGGIVDNLAGIKGFVNNSAAIQTPVVTNKGELKKENYKNLKTQCSYMLADKVNHALMAITAPLSEEDKDSLIEELGQVRRKITDDVTTLQIAPKEEIKENLGRSPDLADMIMMRLYFELDKPQKYVTPPPELGYGGVNPYYENYS